MKREDKKQLETIIDSESFSVIATNHITTQTMVASENTSVQEVTSRMCGGLLKLAQQFDPKMEKKLLQTSAEFFRLKALDVKSDEPNDETDECPGCPACEGEGEEKLAIMIAQSIGASLDVLGENKSTIEQGKAMTDITLNLKNKIIKMYAKDSKGEKTIDLRRKDA